LQFAVISILAAKAMQLLPQYCAVFFLYSGTIKTFLQCAQIFSYLTRERVMPLIKNASKQAFRKNVSAEAKTKPIKQAVAIAYSVQRKAASKASAKGKK